MNTPSKVRTFKDLTTWKEAHKLALFVHEYTKLFPAIEDFRLTNQICRAVVSITSNIAEGFSRNSAKEKSQFYAMGLGSLTEVENQLIIARDLGYISFAQFQKIEVQTLLVNKLIHGLMKTSANRYT